MPNLLEEAADVIHERGWTQGELEEDDGRVCLLGALYTAKYGYPNKSEYPLGYPYFAELRYVLKAIRKRHPGWATGSLATRAIYDYNDLEIEDADDAVHLIKEASELWAEDQ
jgi:hypothetical protein